MLSQQDIKNLLVNGDTLETVFSEAFEEKREELTPR